jgi:hypothetical protein
MGHVDYMHIDGFARFPEPPIIPDFHFHKGRDMKGLGKLVALPTPHGVFIPGLTEHVAVLFKPGRIMDFGHDALHISTIPIVAKVEARGIKTNAEVSEMGKEADWPLRALSQAFLHKISNRSIQWETRVAQMISPTKIGKIYAITGPEPAVPEQCGEFLQIKVHHEQPVLKAVQHGTEPTVSHFAFIYATL